VARHESLPPRRRIIFICLCLLLDPLPLIVQLIALPLCVAPSDSQSCDFCCCFGCVSIDLFAFRPCLVLTRSEYFILLQRLSSSCFYSSLELVSILAWFCSFSFSCLSTGSPSPIRLPAGLRLFPLPSTPLLPTFFLLSPSPHYFFADPSRSRFIPHSPRDPGLSFVQPPSGECPGIDFLSGAPRRQSGL